MKVKVFFDIKYNHKQKSAYDLVSFCRIISMPCLLVPGQNFYLYYDPMVNQRIKNFDDTGHRVVESGCMELNLGQGIPFLVIAPDERDFEEWRDEEIKERRPGDEASWRSFIDKDSSELEARFSRAGWKREDRPWK